MMLPPPADLHCGSFVVSDYYYDSRTVLLAKKSRSGTTEWARNEGIRINLVFVNQFGEHTQLSLL
jgi:hypothetical protein